MVVAPHCHNSLLRQNRGETILRIRRESKASGVSADRPSTHLQQQCWASIVIMMAVLEADIDRKGLRIDRSLGATERNATSHTVENW